jgi:Mn-containing catalase
LSYAKWRIFKGFQLCCSYEVAPEQKARTVYDNLLRLISEPDIVEPLRFLRAREIVHFQRFGEALNITREGLDAKNFYAFNPSIDT